uniref:Uncharacterized protein n=1 Tax=viral metagenome TaxID=1070528 RepID=A0A6C0ILT1_9ZZZZ
MSKMEKESPNLEKFLRYIFYIYFFIIFIHLFINL